LQIWDKKVRNGHIKRITDNDIQSSVLEIIGTNVSTNYITCPAQQSRTLGIKLPFLVMIIKNLKKYFTFEVQVLDDKNVRRRFRASNYQVKNANARVQRVSSHLFVQCPCGSTTAGTKSSLICPTLLAAPMEQTILKLYVSRFMPIAESAESTLAIDFTLRKSYHPSLSFFCQSRSNKIVLRFAKVPRVYSIITPEQAPNPILLLPMQIPLNSISSPSSKNVRDMSSI
jgi:hypothetical protein